MNEQPQVSIDVLAPQKSHIDLADRSLPSDFGMEDFVLSKLYDDFVLVEFCDLASGEGGEYVMRGSLAVPVNTLTNAWRKGRVILKGPSARQTNVGDIVVFPNNMGIPISNLEIKGHGKIYKGLFLNEQRMFGICEEKSLDDK